TLSRLSRSVCVERRRLRGLYESAPLRCEAGDALGAAIARAVAASWRQPSHGPVVGQSPAFRYTAGVKFIGDRLLRKEDPRLVQGQGRYVGDIALPGMLHAAIVRSPHAHARILGIDASRALEAAGVAGVV